MCGSRYSLQCFGIVCHSLVSYSILSKIIVEKLLICDWKHLVWIRERSLVSLFCHPCCELSAMPLLGVTMYILYCRYLCVCWLLLVPMNMQTCWACITIGLNGWSIVNEVWIIFNSIPIATLNNEMGSYGLSLVWLYWVAYSGEGKMCLCCVFSVYML